MSLNKPHLATLKKNLHAYATKRRDIIKNSGDALHHAKRTIFALHRGETNEAKIKLEEAGTLLSAILKKYKKDTNALQEGALREAMEEYVEASLFYQFVTTGKIGPVKTLAIPEEVYLAGLCDIPGELLRYAIRAATKKDLKTVAAAAEMAAEIFEELLEFDLTKYLRHKFDQAKDAGRKIEYVVYEVSLRDK